MVAGLTGSSQQQDGIVSERFIEEDIYGEDSTTKDSNVAPVSMQAAGMARSNGIVSRSFIENLVGSGNSSDSGQNIEISASRMEAGDGTEERREANMDLEADIPNGEPEVRTPKRVILPEIWTLIALEVLEQGDEGAFKGVPFRIELTQVRKLDRQLIVDTEKAGFTSEEIKKLENARLFYPHIAGGEEKRFMQTSARNLKVAVNWKQKGCPGDPKKGPSGAYGSRHFVFHTLKVSASW